jgi:cellulose 1,4-beta-cellobiosidase
MKIYLSALLVCLVLAQNPGSQKQ